MHSLNLSILISTLFLAAACQGNQAQDRKASVPSTESTWIKIEDFESDHPLVQWTLADTQNDTDPQIERPQVTEVRSEAMKDNHYLIKKPAPEGVIGNRKALSYRKLPRALQVGEVYTFYTRFNIEYFPNNHVFGLSNLEPAGINAQAYNALEPSLRITDKYESDGSKNNGQLMVRKGSVYDTINNPILEQKAQPLDPNTWYEVWYIVNNKPRAQGGQSYDVYLRGGPEFPQQQKVYSAADFRMQRELPLLYFLSNCNTGPKDNPYGNGGLRYDDLFMAPGLVLQAPHHE